MSALRPAPGAAVFITLIVKAPIIQILAMILALGLIALEFTPLPKVKELAIYRSFVVRIVLLFFQAFLCILYYQVRTNKYKSFFDDTDACLQGTNACIYSLVAIGCYTRAQFLGETMADAKQNRGRGGQA